MFLCRYRQVPNRKYRLPLADFRGAYVCCIMMCVRSPDMAKMDPNAYSRSCVEWLQLYAQDARRHARQSQ